MNNDTIEKPALDVLLDESLHTLIQCTASRFYSTYGKKSKHGVMIDQQDLASEGYAAIVVAYQSFNPDLGYTDNAVQSFRTHAFPYIKNAMLTYCRKFGHSLSISEKAARDEFQDIISIGVVHMDQLDEDEGFDVPVGSGMDSSQEDVEDFFMAGFSDFERSLVRDHVIDGYSLQEVSDRHNLSKSRAGEILRGLTERMKARAEKYVEND